MERDYATSNASKEVDSPYRPKTGYSTGGGRMAETGGDECGRSCDMTSQYSVTAREGEGEGEMDEEEYYMVVRRMGVGMYHYNLFLLYCVVSLCTAC